jgi:hypothetical protein
VIAEQFVGGAFGVPWSRAERRFIEARSTEPAKAFGGPHDPQDRSVPPYADCGDSASGKDVRYCDAADFDAVEHDRDTIARLIHLLEAIIGGSRFGVDLNLRFTQDHDLEMAVMKSSFASTSRF